MASGNSVKSNIIRKLWIIFFSAIGLFILLFFFISIGWLGYMPSFPELENPKSLLATEIYSADQQLLGTYYFEENRINTTYDQLPPHLKNALLATEDIRFFKHSGIDLRSLGRALFGVLTFSPRGGGSTITQQLAKLFFHDPASNFFMRGIQKLNEWVIAIKLENRYTKEEIMTMYFNKFDFLHNAVGIKSAARIYFNTTPEELNIQQAALLVGMAKNPAYYNPLRRTELSTNRRNVVLRQMYRYDFITEAQYDSLRLLPLGINYQKADHDFGLAPYLRENLRKYLEEWCETHEKPDGTPYNLYKDGLKIYTTINSKMQLYAEQAVAEYLGKVLQPEFFKHWKGVRNAPFSDLDEEGINKLLTDAMRRSDRYYHLQRAGISEEDILKIFKTPTQTTVFSWDGEKDTLISPWDSIRYHKYFLQTGLMSVEPQTGFVRAFVGGINHKYFKYDHVVKGRRQVGSTFKPFVYALAMQEGLSPCTEFPNIPVTISQVNQPDWSPKNSDDAREGQMVSLKWALANSVNYISAQLIKLYTPAAVIQMTRKLGVTSPIDTVPSICLGTPDISVSEMTGAFSAFANKGIYVKPTFITRIEDKNGNVIETFVPKQQEAMSEETAYLMVSLLKGVVEFGTGCRLRYKYGQRYPVAGKTGTTQNQSDGWFIGITPDLTTGVWVGCDDRSAHFRNIYQGQGANTGLPIFGIFMQKVYADTSIKISTGDFERPQKLNVETDCNAFRTQKNSNNLFDDEFR